MRPDGKCSQGKKPRAQPLAKTEFTTKSFFPDGHAELEIDKCQLEAL